MDSHRLVLRFAVVVLLERPEASADVRRPSVPKESHGIGPKDGLA
jgi:hypothetical protein